MGITNSEWHSMFDRNVRYITVSRTNSEFVMNDFPEHFRLIKHFILWFIAIKVDTCSDVGRGRNACNETISRSCVLHL